MCIGLKHVTIWKYFQTIYESPSEYRIFPVSIWKVFRPLTSHDMKSFQTGTSSGKLSYHLPVTTWKAFKWWPFRWWLGGGQNTCKLEFELANKLIPFSMPYRFQKHRAHLWEITGSASSKLILFDQKIQRMFKMYKGKFCLTRFSIFLFLNKFLTKIWWPGVIAEVQTVV